MFLQGLDSSTASTEILNAFLDIGKVLGVNPWTTSFQKEMAGVDGFASAAEITRLFSNKGKDEPEGIGIWIFAYCIDH